MSTGEVSLDATAGASSPDLPPWTVVCSEPDQWLIYMMCSLMSLDPDIDGKRGGSL